MEQIIQDKLIQPKGLAAFGWGLLGCFGGNLIINIICTIGSMIAVSMEHYSIASLLTAIFFVVLAFVLANEFRASRTYQATATGVGVSMICNGLIFIVAFIGGLSA